VFSVSVSSSPGAMLMAARVASKSRMRSVTTATALRAPMAIPVVSVAAGGIDVSVGSVLGLAAIGIGRLLEAGMAPALAALAGPVLGSRSALSPPWS
jgi:ribose/xylose/arabinose/galactoside ABC-type transport system permease subunit